MPITPSAHTAMRNQEAGSILQEVAKFFVLILYCLDGPLCRRLSTVFTLITTCTLARDNTKSHRTGCSVAESTSFPLNTDQIDENLKLALQKDLNVMAPGLTIQVGLFPKGNSSIFHLHKAHS